MKILHLIDDWGFADGPIEVFKTFDVENKFVVLRYGPNKELEKIKNVNDVDVVQIGSESYKKLHKECWDIVWVHGYRPEKEGLVEDSDDHVRVVWSTWGFDYVQYSGQWLFSLRTTFLWLRVTSFRTIIGTLFRYYVGKLGVARFLPRAECRFFRRVNYYSAVVPTEHCFLEKICGRNAKPITFHYVGAKKDTGQIYPLVSLHSKKIWIGNSATLTNNHIDVFYKLKGYCDGYDILTPVSYTLAGEVRDSVTEAIEHSGRELFGDHYKPIQVFMPFKKYVDLMSTCSIFIFAHKRQQSVGNLSIALSCGGCVFMDPDSPVYKFFVSNGFVIYSLSDIEKGKCIEGILNDFSKKQEINIRLMNDIRGYDVLVDEIRKSVLYLQSKLA